MVRSISFRICAKNIFLTYPRCSLPKEECLQLLLSLGWSVKPFYIRVCSELSQEDGRPHLHCLLQFEQKFQTQNKRFFDLLSSTRSTHFHPNIQSAKSAFAVQSYISKAGDYVDHGDFQPPGGGGRSKSRIQGAKDAFAVQSFISKAGDYVDHGDFQPTAGGRSKSNIEGAENACAVQSYIFKAGDYVHRRDFQPTGGRSKSKAHKLDDLYYAALATKNKELALSMIREGDPKGYISRYKKLSSNFDLIFQTQPEPYRNPYPSFDQVPDGILKWAHNNIKEEAQILHRPMSIIIEGPSGIGKTAWARSLGPHNYYTGHTDFTKHRDDVFYNVIDNVVPKCLKYWRQIIGSKTDWTSDCRYAKPKLIKGGIPAIILCNPGKETSYRDYLELGKNKGLKDWTLMNAEFFFIQRPFFSTSSQHQASTRHSEEGNT